MAPEQRKAGRFSSRSDGTSHPGNRSSTRNPEGLLKRLLIIFCLLGLIALGANVKFLLDTSAEIGKHVETGLAPSAKLTVGATIESLATLQAAEKRIALLLGITFLCFGSMVYLFVKRVVVPLNLVTQIAKDLSRGDLSVTALSNPHGDVGELGAALNDLAANFQEILLLMGTTVGNSCSIVARIESTLETADGASHDEIRKQLENLRKDLSLLRSLVQEFKYYQIHFDGQKVVSDNMGRES